MAFGLERAVVEWSRGLAAHLGAVDVRIVNIFGEGVQMLPLVIVSTLCWFVVQFSVVPLCNLLAPSFVDAVKGIAEAKARRTKQADKTPAVMARSMMNDLGVRTVALVFSCVASYGAIKLALYPPPMFDQDMFFAAAPEALFYCAVAAGYFVWDVPVSLYHRYGAGFLLHAVSCLIVECIAIHPLMQPVMSWAHLYELSTPFLNVRLMMIASGHTKGRIFKACEMSFCIVFFLTRIVYGYYKSWGFVTHAVADLLSDKSLIAKQGPLYVPMAWLAVSICTLLAFLNTFWFSRIAMLGLGGSSKKRKTA